MSEVLDGVDGPHKTYGQPRILPDGQYVEEAPGVTADYTYCYFTIDTAVVGTEVAGAFVVTADGVFGAGPNTAYEGIEGIEGVEGEGVDDFYILRTHPQLVTTIIGGLGADSFHVTGDVTSTIYAMELEGRSGVINHGTASAAPHAVQ